MNVTQENLFLLKKRGLLFLDSFYLTLKVITMSHKHFLVKDLVIFGFPKFLREGLL